jgi:transcriptional regulator with XRE-family HTH domain
MATTSPTTQLFDQAVGRRIKQLRETARLTQAEVADYLTAHGRPSTLQITYRLERGDRTLTLWEAVTLAELFGVSVASLAGEPEPEPQPVTASRSTSWDVERLTDRVRQMEAELERLTMEARQPALISAEARP